MGKPKDGERIGAYFVQGPLEDIEDYWEGPFCDAADVTNYINSTSEPSKHRIHCVDVVVMGNWEEVTLEEISV